MKRNPVLNRTLLSKITGVYVYPFEEQLTFFALFAARNIIVITAFEKHITEQVGMSGELCADG